MMSFGQHLSTNDGRSVAAKCYQQSKQQTKTQMECDMIAKALNEVFSLQTQDKIDFMEKIEQTIIDLFMLVIKIDIFTLRLEALE